MKSLRVIQPVSHLRNYRKYIAPVLNTGHSVHLTKNGHSCWTISPDNSNNQNLNIDHYARKIAGKIIEQHLNCINSGKKYSPEQIEKMMNNF